MTMYLGGVCWLADGYKSTPDTRPASSPSTRTPPEHMAIHSTPTVNTLGLGAQIKRVMNATHRKAVTCQSCSDNIVDLVVKPSVIYGRTGRSTSPSGKGLRPHRPVSAPAKVQTLRKGNRHGYSASTAVAVSIERARPVSASAACPSRRKPIVPTPPRRVKSAGTRTAKTKPTQPHIYQNIAYEQLLDKQRTAQVFSHALTHRGHDLRYMDRHASCHGYSSMGEHHAWERPQSPCRSPDEGGKGDRDSGWESSGSTGSPVTPRSRSPTHLYDRFIAAHRPKLVHTTVRKTCLVMSI